MNTLPKIYVGCSLTGAAPIFIDSVAAFKARMGYMTCVLDYRGLDPLASAKEIYEQDILRCVARCNAMIALCDHHSTGLGIEVSAALFKYEVPVLLLAQNDAVVSKLVQGLPHYHPCCMFTRYDSLQVDAPTIARNWIETIFPRLAFS